MTKNDLKIFLRTYSQNGYYWFELLQETSNTDPKAPLEVLYRRRYRTSAEAKRCGDQAIAWEHEKRNKRREHAPVYKEAAVLEV